MFDWMHRGKVERPESEFRLEYMAAQKAKEELTHHSTQQLQAQIRALIAEFCDLYDGDLANEAVSLLLTKLRKLSAVRKPVWPQGQTIKEANEKDIKIRRLDD